MLAKTTSQKQRYWLDHVKAADLSDGTIADYASKTNISLKSLYQWKTKLIRLKLYNPVASSDSDFVPVHSSSIQSQETAERPGCIVSLSNGTRIEFHGEFSVHFIRSVITTASHAH